MRTIIEPFRIKSIEPIEMSSPEMRSEWLTEAGHNLFRLPAERVLIDLLTDSGTAAMSARQWGAMMAGDESYAGARSWYRFEETVRRVFGFAHVVPTHQGRAAERILFGCTVNSGDVVPSNAHFDTTRANIEYLGGHAVDLPCAEAADPTTDEPFKGNVDLAALEALLDARADDVPLIMLTITNNTGGGQPVSMANIRAVAELAHRFGKPLYIDACRFAENAWFIKQREPGYAGTSIPEIVHEMFSHADGCTMSAKKDALVNIGGFLCTRDPSLAEREKNLLILSEGFPTYGGLAGRDLEAIAAGLEEVLHEDYLRYRIVSTAYVVDHLHDAGVPVVRPAGGHAVYLDAGRFLPHIPALQYPGQSLAAALYQHAGIRGVEIGTVMAGRDPDTGAERPPQLELVRLAIPRRVYTQSHMDYVVEAIVEVFERRDRLAGYRITDEPPFLRHFTATFAPLG
ncbi:tryptophanase [Actinobacteria bacterium YIM 96077]|uniref:Tyrosine phenol-lyase n=1 Tax=Phytoactinopolyspora halophila TaxID=1981511 RepID=A0A329QFL1_9ACTN|nr:tryptophanase [Phytoactinopolyspora halophila]AYY13583.1 tryptophanase [Actinobacteria bacterium YIM 96077]RAW10751.1 tyrosine phenol-lyase [Phytoactinopolyspora halophila]